MALDNVLALFLLPVLGALSDKTHTRIGAQSALYIGGHGLRGGVYDAAAGLGQG